MLSFEQKAENKALNILKNYDYCLVTPIKFINEFFEAETKKPVHCTTIEQIRDLFNNEDDVMIETPDGCNY
jgi:hypothetical protein